MSIPSMFNGLSGINAHQRMLDVIGHNIANVNTKGYKRFSMRITESSSPTTRPALTPTSSRGGLNPIQIGYGVKVGNLSLDDSQGNLEQTGRELDLGIEGEGFFVLSDSQRDHYTRVGNFTIDSNNNLIDQATGFFVQSPDGNITIDRDSPIAPTETTEVDFKGNLDPSTAIGGTVTTTINVWDDRGESHAIDFTFTRLTDLTWGVAAASTNPAVTVTDATADVLALNADGSYDDTNTVSDGIAVTWPNGSTVNITYNFASADGIFDGITQVGGNSTASATDQNGFGSGNLLSIAVNPDGAIMGQYSNGELREISAIQIASFANPEGLEKERDGMYVASANSGLPVLGRGMSGRAGSVVSGALEASNVDISKEITQMIIAQRGFQVNARAITVSNDILEEISNLTR